MDLTAVTSYLNNNANWIVLSFVVIFAALLFDLIQRRVLDKVAKRFERTPNLWDDTLLESIRKPFSLLIWIVGVTSAIKIMEHQVQSSAFWFVEPLRSLGVIAALTWFVVRFITLAEKNIIIGREAKGQSVDLTTLDAVTKLLRLSVYITAGLVTLQTMGFSVSGVLAFGGVGGIAVGFAARGLLANFFGGFMIYMDRPFSVGDWIRSPDRDIEGTVEKIGWRITVIRTFSKRPLYIPNAAFSSISVENPTRMTNRRIYETIGIRYDDIKKLPIILKNTEKMLKNHPEIDATQTLMVNFNKFAPSSLELFVYTFTKTTNWQRFHEVKQDVLLKIADIIDSQGAEIAYPTTTLNLSKPFEIQTQDKVT